MKTVIHVTHEAVQKIGGIGAVLHGLLTSKAYNTAIQRDILMGPLFTTDGPAETRLHGGEVLYSSIDGIVNQLLEFSRPAKPLLAEASLHAIIRGPLKLISEAAYKKQVAIETHFDAADDTLLADLHQLPQALLNFLLNALEAIAGNGRITLTTSVVEGRYDPAGAADALPRPYLKLDITDTGCGMPPDTLLRIFDPFFTTKSSGTGLGLAVAHGIIAEHGGSVEVDSRVGQGTSFHLFFPQVTHPAA